MPSFRLRSQGATVVLGILTACMGIAGVTTMEPRLAAVSATLSAMGLVPAGPVQRGTLVQGEASRMRLTLPAGCATIVAVGADGTGNLDAALFDAKARPLAHAPIPGPTATLHVCLDAPDTYALVVRGTGRGGAFVVAAWVGASATVGQPLAALGTCRSPIPLSRGLTTGSTTLGASRNTGSCGGADSREVVYEFDVTRRQRVTFEAEGDFDTVLYLRRDDCEDAAAEVGCDDDSTDNRHSRLERVLEAGRYFLFVDGYDKATGPFKLAARAADAPLAVGDCHDGPALVDGVVNYGTALQDADGTAGACGARTTGSGWRLSLPARSRVRIVEHTEDGVPALHVRRVCGDERSEIACSESGSSGGDATIVGVLDRGNYGVFADWRERRSEAKYALSVQTAPPEGTRVVGDDCDDAVDLADRSSGEVDGDTFQARNDVSGSCGGDDAADVVYRLDVPQRSRLEASLDAEEARHVLIAWKRCGDAQTEVACGSVIREVVEPGRYFLAVDGLSPEAFGAFHLTWTLDDVSGQDRACSLAEALVSGRSTTGSTPDKHAFFTRCRPGFSSAERLYKLVLAQRAHVRLRVSSAADVVISLRATCADGFKSPPAELACTPRSSILQRFLDAGTYWVLVSGRAGARNDFKIEYSAIP
jgi:hypothetical protein